MSKTLTKVNENVINFLQENGYCFNGEFLYPSGKMISDNYPIVNEHDEFGNRSCFYGIPLECAIWDSDLSAIALINGNITEVRKLHDDIERLISEYRKYLSGKKSKGKGNSGMLMLPMITKNIRDDTANEPDIIVALEGSRYDAEKYGIEETLALTVATEGPGYDIDGIVTFFDATKDM